MLLALREFLGAVLLLLKKRLCFIRHILHSQSKICMWTYFWEAGMRNVERTTLIALAVAVAGGAQADEVVRLGNLKLAHFGAVSYIKEIAPRCGIRVEEKIFAK